jgi:hypothetical protein
MSVKACTRHAGLLALLLAFVTASAAPVVQHGHPLVGIWSGDWGLTPEDRSPVLIDMNWQTTTLSGTINPGFPDAAEIDVGVLDSKNWTVHLEASGTDRDGNAVRIVVDGRLDELGSEHRTLTGTWNRNGITGDFKLTRE